jgi:hypothetical protein
MPWTDWRKIADRNSYFSEVLYWDGPCCYELALGGPRGGIRFIIYTGETRNERQRMLAYGRHGSHLSKILNAAPSAGMDSVLPGNFKKQ